MRERSSWVDIAKTIGIVLVVYGHVARGVHAAGVLGEPVWFKLVDSVIYSFHMPLFFFLSGLFFRESLIKRGGVGLFANKIDTILYPYLLWSLLQGGVEVLLSRYTNGDTTVSDVLAVVWRPRAQFWFLYALYLICVLGVIVYVRARSTILFPVVAICAILNVVASYLPAGQISGYVAGNAVFFTLGVWFNESAGEIGSRGGRYAVLVGALFVASQYLFHFTSLVSYEISGAASLVLALVSIYFVATASMWLASFRLRWLTVIGSSSMAIYLMHILAGSGARVLLGNVMGIESGAVHLAIGTIAGLAIPLLALRVIGCLRWGFLLTPPRWLSFEAQHSRVVSKSSDCPVSSNG